MTTRDARRHLYASFGFSLVGLGFSAGWLAQARFMETPVAVVCEPAPSRPAPAPALQSSSRPPQEPRLAPLEGAPVELAELDVELDALSLEPLTSDEAPSAGDEPPPDLEIPEEPVLGDEPLELTVGQTQEVSVRGRIVQVQADPPLLTWSYTSSGLRLFATAEGVGSLTVETQDSRTTVAVTVDAPFEPDAVVRFIDLSSRDIPRRKSRVALAPEDQTTPAE